MNQVNREMTDRILKAIYTGKISIGDKALPCAVLEDETRIITQAALLKSLGRSRSPKAGTGVMSTVDGLPFLLQAKVLKPFINDDLRVSTAPVMYENSKGAIEVGYNALLLPRIAEAYLQFRDHELKNRGTVSRQYQHIVDAADILIRGLAHVGIIALIDEATGYQDRRAKTALQKILDKYLLKEYARWAKRFPDEFYQEMFRLKNWEWKGMNVSRPGVIGIYTNDLVYERLAPGVLHELQKRNPSDESGRRKTKHHQWLTDDIGIPELSQHIFALITLMRISTSWAQFHRNVERAFPKIGETIPLAFDD